MNRLIQTTRDGHYRSVICSNVCVSYVGECSYERICVEVVPQFAGQIRRLFGNYSCHRTGNNSTVNNNRTRTMFSSLVISADSPTRNYRWQISGQSRVTLFAQRVHSQPVGWRHTRWTSCVDVSSDIIHNCGSKHRVNRLFAALSGWVCEFMAQRCSIRWSWSISNEWRLRTPASVLHFRLPVARWRACAALVTSHYNSVGICSRWN